MHSHPYFSNPNVTYNGQPVGTAENAFQPTNNAHTLNNTAFTVANFRGCTQNCQGGATPTLPPSCVSAPANQFAWWRGEGDAVDLVGLYPGTIGGGATFAGGKMGQAFSFDGTTGYVATNLDVQASAM